MLECVKLITLCGVTSLIFWRPHCENCTLHRQIKGSCSDSETFWGLPSARSPRPDLDSLCFLQFPPTSQKQAYWDIAGTGILIIVCPYVGSVRGWTLGDLCDSEQKSLLTYSDFIPSYLQSLLDVTDIFFFHLLNCPHIYLLSFWNIDEEKNLEYLGYILSAKVNLKESLHYFSIYIFHTGQTFSDLWIHLFFSIL